MTSRGYSNRCIPGLKKIRSTLSLAIHRIDLQNFCSLIVVGKIANSIRRNRMKELHVGNQTLIIKKTGIKRWGQRGDDRWEKIEQYHAISDTSQGQRLGRSLIQAASLQPSKTTSIHLG
jgi:hypothetical protein